MEQWCKEEGLPGLNGCHLRTLKRFKWGAFICIYVGVYMCLHGFLFIKSVACSGVRTAFPPRTYADREQSMSALWQRVKL